MAKLAGPWFVAFSSYGACGNGTHLLIFTLNSTGSADNFADTYNTTGCGQDQHHSQTFTIVTTSSAERRGREAFVARGCAHCHGDHRQGTDRAPELLSIRKRMKKDAIEKQIHDGGQMMPAFGADLSASELTDLVAYVREKKEPAADIDPSH